jgi:glycosyltransferase involved in cell wall biosynthesis
MRIGWYSNAPHIASGYGQQTAQVVERLKVDGHDPAVISNFGAAASLNWKGIPVFADGLKQYSVDIFPQQLKAWGGVSIGLFDAWPMIAIADQLKGLNLAWWVPIDHDPVPPGIVEFFAKTGAFAIAMTRFGEEQLLKIGMPKNSVAYIPHAIDTKEMFTDVGQDAREAMGIPKTAHLTVMNAANRGRLPIRKAFAENLLALSEFMKTHPDAWAYIHTEPEGISDGMNLPRYLNFINAPMDRFRWPEPMAYRNGIPTESLRHIYSAADCVLGTSMGEGFGVPTIEAQACGTPVIVSQFAGSTELAGPFSTLIHGQKMWDEFQGSYWIVPDVRQIHGALVKNYQEKRDGIVDREKVRQFALHYDADLIYDTHWRPLIERLAKRTAPTVSANRAERRAKKR